MVFFQKLFIYITGFFLALSPANSYVEGVSGQPSSFLPTKATNPTDKTISQIIYRGLFKYDIYGALIPDLADTWQISEDGLTYTIKIKDNQFWSSGRRITSDDLIYTSFKDANLAYVATDKVDELTLRYTLPNKYAPFLSLLTNGVMPQNAEETNNALFPISSGDFRVARIEKNGSYVKQVVLATTKETYNIKRIVFRYYSNEEELETAAKLGEIDAFSTTERKSVENFADHKFPIQSIYYGLFLNEKSPVMQDQTLRQKMEKSLPISQIIGERGIRVQGPISRSVFTNPALKWDKYDPLFKESQVNIVVKMVIPDLSDHKELARNIKEYWEGIMDIDIELSDADPDRIVSEVIEPRNYDILLYGQEVGRDPDRYVLWHSTQKEAPGLNLSYFEHVRADRALEEGRNELDNEKRIIHYNEFQKVVNDQVPAIFLYHPYVNYYITKHIQGVGEKYTFTYADRFLDFHNWKRVKTN